MAALLNKPLVVFLMFVLLIKPDSFAAVFPQLSAAYNVGTLFVFACVLLLALTTTRFSLLTVYVTVFQGFFVCSTYINGGNIDTAVFTFLRVIALCCLIESGIRVDCRSLLMGGVIAFFAYLLINLITIVAFPNGLYLSAQTGNACYFLGHRNVLSKTLLPGLLLSYLLDYIDKRCFGKRFITYFILYAVTEVAVWSASGLASLLVVIAIYAIAITKSHALKHGMMMAAGIGALGTISIVVLRLQELFSFLIVDVLHRDLTLTTRTIVWDKAFDVIESAPIFGYGLEESVTAQIRFGTVESSHNYFLDQIYYGGVVALCLLMLGLYMLGSRLRKCPSKEVVAVLASCLGGFFCLGIVEPLGMGFAYLIIPVVVSYHACSFESAAHPSKEMSNERS